MKGYFLLASYLMLSACNHNVVPNKNKSSVPAPSNTNNTTTTKLKNKQLSIHNNRLYYFRTPQEDIKLFIEYNRMASKNSYNTYLTTKKQKEKNEIPYYLPLLNSLKKHHPETDAKYYLTKGQRFLLAYEYTPGKVKMSGTLLYPFGLGRGQTSSKYRNLKCNFGQLKGVEGIDPYCVASSTNFCFQFDKVKTDYIIRWNRVMLEHCRKNQSKS